MASLSSVYHGAAKATTVLKIFNSNDRHDAVIVDAVVDIAAGKIYS